MHMKSITRGNYQVPGEMKEPTNAAIGLKRD